MSLLLFFLPCMLSTPMYPCQICFIFMENLSKKWQDFQSTWWAERRDLVEPEDRGSDPRVLWERNRVKGNRKKTGEHSDGPEMTSAIFKVIGNRCGPLGLMQKKSTIYSLKSMKNIETVLSFLTVLQPMKHLELSLCTPIRKICLQIERIGKIKL